MTALTLPNFLVIGAARSGTASLYHYLRQHPQIYMCPLNEPNFFALEGLALETCFHGPVDRQNVERYCVGELSAYSALFAEGKGAKAIGESSPLYLYSPHAPGHIHQHLPCARLIAILRHPADRAYSNFLDYVRVGIEPLKNFSQALRVEADRIRAGWGPWPFWHYTRVGFYAAQLRHYFQLFPREQVRIYLYDDFSAHPQRVLQDIFGFLEVEATFRPDTSVRHNLSGQPRSETLHNFLQRPNRWRAMLKRLLPAGVGRWLGHHGRALNLAKPPLASAIRRELVQLYREDILELQELLQRDLSTWLKDTP